MNLELVLAIYGSVLASVLAIFQVWQSQRKMKVILEFGIFTNELVLIISNKRTKPVVISNIEMGRFGYVDRKIKLIEQVR